MLLVHRAHFKLLPVRNHKMIKNHWLTRTPYMTHF